MSDIKVGDKYFALFYILASYAVRLSPACLAMASALVAISECVDLAITCKYIPLSSW